MEVGGEFYVEKPFIIVVNIHMIYGTTSCYIDKYV